MSAGSAAARSAVDAFTNSRDRMKRAEQEAAIQAELAKLEGTKAPMNAPRAEFGAQGGAGLQGFGFGAPQGGEITSAPTGRTQGLALPQGASLSAGADAGDSAGFQAGNVAPAPRALSGSEREAIYGNVARIKGDINGMRLSDQNRAAFKFKEDFSQHMQAFDSDDKDMVDQAIRQLNTTDGVVTVGDPDKKGYRDLSYVDADGKGKFTRLSRTEQAQLYAAGQMMGSNPDEALDKIRGINKELGDALARRNTSVIGVTGANNTVNNLRNDDTRADQTLASQEQHRKDQSALGWARLRQDGAHQAAVRSAAGDRRSGNLMEFVDAKGNTVLIDTGAAPRGADGVVGLPTGLTPKTVRPQLTPADRYKLAIEYATNNSVDLGEALLRIESLYAAQSGGVPGAGSAGNPLVIPGLQAENTARQQPAPVRAPVQLPPAMTLRQAQEAANRTNPPRDLRGLVLEQQGGGSYPGLEYLTR